MESEDPRAQDERVENLWRTLDTRQEGQLSLEGLKNGLRKLDHRGYWTRFGKEALMV